MFGCVSGRRWRSYLVIGLVALGLASALGVGANLARPPLLPEQGARWIAIGFLSYGPALHHGSRIEGWSVLDDHYQSSDLVITDQRGTVLKQLANNCRGYAADRCHHRVWVVELTAKPQRPADNCYSMVVIDAIFGRVHNWLLGCASDD
jgi:hypothetical protein